MFDKEEKWLLEEKYHGEKSFAFFADLEKLKKHTPLAYLIGYIPFLNCKIYLDSKPLIPRPETEFWVEKVIELINSRKSQSLEKINILDLCAGSGCIGVAVAKNISNTSVDFTELDPAHQNTIAKNCSNNEITDNRYRILIGNLFSPLKEEKYDFILSNPPYIDKTLERVEYSVAKNEPELALYGGNQGLELIKEIIEKAPNYLKPNGQLWIEHEPEQSESINKLAENDFLVKTHQDQYQIERFTQLILNLKDN